MTCRFRMQFFALYSLVAIYHATHQELAAIHPLRKFILIKMVVFFTFWQGFALSIASYFHLIGSESFSTYETKALATSTQVRDAPPLHAPRSRVVNQLRPDQGSAPESSCASQDDDTDYGLSRAFNIVYKSTATKQQSAGRNHLLRVPAGSAHVCGLLPGQGLLPAGRNAGQYYGKHH